MLSVAFAPVEAGVVESTLSVDNNAPPVATRLAGTGVGPGVSAEGTVIDFGDVLSLATDTLELRVSNMTSAEIKIDSVVTSGRLH